MKYTYLWLREDGTPYYVGMGNKRRATARHRIGHAPPRERVILQEWSTTEEAQEAERFLIALFGRMDIGSGCLRNLTDGGEGAPNPSALVRQRQSEGTRKTLAATPLAQLKAYGRQGATVANARMTKEEKCSNGSMGATATNEYTASTRSAWIKAGKARMSAEAKIRRRIRAVHSRWHIGETFTRYGVHTNIKDANCPICSNLQGY